MNTPTPRTDEAEFSFDTFNGVDPWEGERWIKVVPSKISAELESELTAATKERDEARGQANDMREKWLAKGLCCEHLGAELHQAINHCDEAREELAGIENKMRVELGGHPDSKLWGEAGLIAATMRCVDALGEVTDQRDRLAADLRIIADGTSCRECGGEDQARLAREALQSLFCDALQSLTPNQP